MSSGLILGVRNPLIPNGAPVSSSGQRPSDLHATTDSFVDMGGVSEPRSASAVNETSPLRPPSGSQAAHDTPLGDVCAKYVMGWSVAGAGVGAVGGFVLPIAYAASELTGGSAALVGIVGPLFGWQLGLALGGLAFGGVGLVSSPAVVAGAYVVKKCRE
jgi:hypothetical protein